jgi:hypothetical protein
MAEWIAPHDTGLAVPATLAGMLFARATTGTALLEEILEAVPEC